MALQELLQVPIAQATVFRIEVPHHGDLLHRPGDALHRPKVRRQLPAAAEDAGGGEVPVLPQVGGESLRPDPDQTVRAAGGGLIGPGLPGRQHQRVAPEGGGQGPPGHGKGYRQRRIPLQVPDVQAQQGHLAKARPVQHRPQEADQAGAPAGVPRLGDQHAGARRVVPPGLQGGEHLPGDEGEGVAQVAVEMPQPQMLRALPLLQHHGLPRVRRESPPQQRPVGVQQGGDQQRPLHGVSSSSSSSSIRTRLSTVPGPVEAS